MNSIMTTSSGPSLAVVQPYFFPYLGYFQLIYAVDKLVFYDDVKFIKSGWINRNRILIHNSPAWLTVHVEKASSNRLIRDTKIKDNRAKLLRTIECAYSQAPFFEDAFSVISPIFLKEFATISDVSMASILAVLQYLGIKREIYISSQAFADTSGLGRSERLIEIAKRCDAAIYLNPVAGAGLYRVKDFKQQGVDFHVLTAQLPAYVQFRPPFQPRLSIIDVLMFNSPERAYGMLGASTTESLSFSVGH